MWCKEFGGYSHPFFFLASSTNLVNQWSSSEWLSSDRGAISDFVVLMRCSLHDSQTLTQYLVSFCVLNGTPCILASVISSSLFGVANRSVVGHRWEELELTAAALALSNMRTPDTLLCALSREFRRRPEQLVACRLCR